MWHTYLQEFFKTHDYPEAAVPPLLESLNSILAHEKMGAALLDAVSQYESWESPEKEAVKALLAQVRQASREYGFQNETAELLLFLMLCRHLEQLYQRKGLPAAWFLGVPRDLRSKLNECYTIRGIWGSFVADWFVWFFSLDRFVMGRLQFECIPIPASYCPAGFEHMAGQPAVNLHIPSGAPLRQSDVQASMAEAAKFYAHRFPDGNVLFICHSWLLFPGHLEMLPDSSGIRQFMSQFTLAGTYEDPDRHDLWRIFHTDDVKNENTLPQDTSLQRAYVQWLKAGKTVGGGIGIRFMKCED